MRELVLCLVSKVDMGRIVSNKTAVTVICKDFRFFASNNLHHMVSMQGVEGINMFVRVMDDLNKKGNYDDIKWNRK